MLPCHLTTAVFANELADGPFLDTNWKCRVPGCGKLPGEHPTPAPAPHQGSYLDPANFIAPFSHPYFIFYIMNFICWDSFYLFHFYHVS